MCDLATNWSNTSVGVRNDIPASGVVFSTTGRGDDRKAEDNGQKKNLNAKESKHDKKIERWNYGGNHFARDCTNPAKKEGDKKGKLNVTFTDYDDEDYGDGVILICFEYRCSGYFQNDDANENLELDDENDSMPDLEAILIILLKLRYPGPVIS